MLRRYFSTLLLLALLCAGSFAAAARKPSLHERIDQILSQPEVARGFWGIEIVSLPKGKVLYARNEHKLFTPASNTKLFTTAAALALIGPDYRFRTTVETTGSLDKYGRLTSDLLLVGRGDPNLSGRVLPYNLHTERDAQPIKVLSDLADDLVRKGLKFVDGNVVADDSYYAFERYGEGWSQDDLVWGDGAPVSALTINDNVVFVNILPADHIGDRAFVSITPFADYYRIDNRIITTPPGTGPRKIYINREPGSHTLTLWGNMPVDDAGANEALAIEDPADYAAQLFRELLEARGVVIYGRTRSRHTELASLSTVTVTSLASHGGGVGSISLPDQRVVLAGYQSQPLSEDLTVINKVSQNLHAELLLRLLGREKGNAGTIEAGKEVVRTFLTQQVGMIPDEFVFYDGSGLSRENLVTPHAIVQLLQYAATQPWALLYEGTLPVAGVDGSLADRFKGTPGMGHIQGKTGSLNHVNALSGYATTAKGEKIAF
ncbi:MAG TPA: D-alanyl-D-alanine carboxypeptidase/D-alanyl-D-alanine-endopeptidase, partial [Terriglobales bacterium]|nr:D-alanyl-D-alanine carboxypeptidase/D-alanyl-D-alanine-endopeptidase [Terriglobales bacterium]